MARREPKNTRQDARSKSSSSSVSSEEDSDSASSTSPNNPNQLPKANGALDMEPEYHTEDSDASTSDDNEEEDPDEEVEQPPALPTQDAPFLPPSLLKNLPSPTHSLSNVLDIPWNEMTREQKRIERHRSRRSKKRSWDMFPPVPAEVKALRKRKAERRRLEMGRKGKGVEKRRVQVSGRQRMLVERRRVVERGGREALRNMKKTTPKR